MFLICKSCAGQVETWLIPFSKFGASLAFSNKKGTGGASAPQILADTTIPSDAEVVVMLGKACEKGTCGFVRPGSVAYRMFDTP